MEASSVSHALEGESVEAAAGRGNAARLGAELLLALGVFGSALLIYAAIGFGIYSIVVSLM
jgi:hypothetical protein